MKTKFAVSVLQLVAAIAFFPLFFSFVPWAFSDPISSMNTTPRMNAGDPPPEWARYYTVGGGVVTYFRTSPREEPLRALLHGGSLGACVLLLIISGRYYTHREAAEKEAGDSEAHPSSVNSVEAPPRSE
jgi:hypothetical protein